VSDEVVGNNSGNYRIFVEWRNIGVIACRDFRYQLSAGQYITAWEAGSKKGQLSENFSYFSCC
jgi:hypothetical protein